jgi:hypothetical protein
MHVERNGTPITCLDDWERVAPPKAKHHWTAGRSAYELAHAWCGPSGPAMPDAVHTLFESIDETRGMVIDVAMPEHRIWFDTRRGEPRNADLAFVGRTAVSTVAVTVEAKADEPFGATVATTLATARERAKLNPRSLGVQRVEDLVRALFAPRTAEHLEIGRLRYQLLTAVAGTLAYAKAEGASTAMLLVHEFVTNRTKASLHARNDADCRAFLTALGEPATPLSSSVAGPFNVPGAPLFSDLPALLIGKVVTDRRSGDAEGEVGGAC